jgi:hypothetical protein
VLTVPNIAAPKLTTELHPRRRPLSSPPPSSSLSCSQARCFPPQSTTCLSPRENSIRPDGAQLSRRRASVASEHLADGATPKFIPTDTPKLLPDGATLKLLPNIAAPSSSSPCHFELTPSLCHPVGYKFLSIISSRLIKWVIDWISWWRRLSITTVPHGVAFGSHDWR